ncbi:MAG TPA: DUF4159 domain-containing protein [Candidatus Acidoferrum sp.]|nr:DUF4159 domain-containing protein [Candidatus Acidoferrum sp.]
MITGKHWRRLAIGSVVFLTVLSAQRPFREYPGNEYNDFPLPADWQTPGEWAFARLMYPPAMYGFGGRGYGRFRGGDWREGRSSWTTDYPRSDRHFSEAMRRLTRVSTRSVEQPVNLDWNDEYDWPFLYAVEVGHWDLTDVQAKALREYLLRGGFFMCDDFHGTREWEVFLASMRRVFPDRDIVDLDDKDPIFHTIYDLDDRYQVPGAQYIRSGRTWEYDGYKAVWRGIYDDKGRLMVAIVHNSDLGDSWEHADNPQYKQEFSALGIRIGINYVVYSMTH